MKYIYIFRRYLYIFSSGITEQVLSHCTNPITGTGEREAANPCATNLGHICVKQNENIKVFRASKHLQNSKKNRLKTIETILDEIYVCSYVFYVKICRNTTMSSRQTCTHTPLHVFDFWSLNLSRPPALLMQLFSVLSKFLKFLLSARSIS